jgi:hypothetical protein
MMSQSGVTACLLSAIQLVLGPKANGAGVDALRDAMEQYLRKHAIAELVRALPYGQRDLFRSNAALLERHAVTMAALADTLVKLKLVSGRRVSADRILKQQAQELAGTYHLADSARDELKRLTALRAAQQARIAGYLGPRPSRA